MTLYPTLSTENGNISLINSHLCNLLDELLIYIVRDKNIVGQHVGGKGLHVNSDGDGRLVL